LYLEWAPVDVLSGEVTAKPEKIEVGVYPIHLFLYKKS